MKHPTCPRQPIHAKRWPDRAPLAARYAYGSSAEDQQQSSVTLTHYAPRSPANPPARRRPAAAAAAGSPTPTAVRAVDPSRDRGVPTRRTDGRRDPDLRAPAVEGGRGAKSPNAVLRGST